MEIAYNKLNEVLQRISRMRAEGLDDEEILDKQIRVWRALRHGELMKLHKQGLSLSEIIAEMLRRKAAQREKDALLADPFAFKRLIINDYGQSNT